jgi:hypothetical protein
MAYVICQAVALDAERFNHVDDDALGNSIVFLKV